MVAGWSGGTRCSEGSTRADRVRTFSFDLQALPAMDVDGTNYLYDAAGDFMGVEHLVLTEEGTPFGVFDPETNSVEECDFEFEE